MTRRPAAWLLAQLPQLERDKIVDAETAARLRAHYAQAAQQEPQLAAPLTALLGALLVGLGLILLIAHNWQQWPVALRLFVAALPLAAAQAACVYTLKRRADSRVWREASALLTGLAAAALLALVAQIFHFRGDLHLYLLSCILLALPLVYVLDASLLAALLAAAMLGMVAAEPEALRQPWHALLLFAGLLPHLFGLWRQAPRGLRLSLLLSLWTALLAAALSLAMTPLRAYGWLWCAELAGLLLLADSASSTLRTLPLRPLRTGGEILWAIVAMAASFSDFWRGSPYGGAGLAQANAVLLLTLLLVLLLALRALLHRQWLMAAAALPALLLAALQGRVPPAAGALVLLVNLYVLAIGVACIAQGLRHRELRRISGGLTLLAALVLLRFFGGEWPFVLRGLAFVVVGLGFLFAHAWLRRRLRTA